MTEMLPPRGGQSLRGENLREISSALVALYRELFGRGPTAAKAYAHDDLVVCVLRNGLTTIERTLYQGGKADVVRQMRSAFQDAVAERFIDVIERHTGRRVIAFMSQAHVDPDLAIEVFVLEQAPDGAGADGADPGADGADPGRAARPEPGDA